MAPELFTNRVREAAFPIEQVDVFALAVILVNLLTGHFLFKSALDEDYSTILNNGYHNNKIPGDIMELIKQMLQPSVNKRITLAEVERHPFVQDCVLDPALVRREIEARIQ